MNCLLDTHTFLWAAFSPAKLSAKARKEIRSAENRVCLSTVSFWEISLKFALGKIDLVNCNPDDMPGIAAQMLIEVIQPTAQEAMTHKLDLQPATEMTVPRQRQCNFQAQRRNGWQ